MSTTVTFAGNLADQKPFVSCRVLVNPRVENDAGEWVNGEPTPHNVTVYGTAATRVHDGCGSGDPVFVHGLGRTESWPAKGRGEERARNVVVVDNRFGEGGMSLRSVSAWIGCAGRAAAHAG